jgi:uncharacterized membrane protein
MLLLKQLQDCLIISSIIITNTTLDFLINNQELYNRFIYVITAMKSLIYLAKYNKKIMIYDGK